MSDDTIEAFGRKWKRVWVEDDATRGDPTAEHLRQAWKRLFGEEYPGSKNAPEEDHGDTFYYLFGERVYVMAYDGDSIYVLAEAARPVCHTAAGMSETSTKNIRELIEQSRGVVDTDVTLAAERELDSLQQADPYTAMAREFHQRMGLVTRDAPSLGTPAERGERVRLLLEELLELAGALGVSVWSESGDPISDVRDFTFSDTGVKPESANVLHELADLQVTVSGTAAQFGLPLLAAAREVHRANMEKTPQGPGRKPLKPEGWKAADVSEVLAGSNGGES